MKSNYKMIAIAGIVHAWENDTELTDDKALGMIELVYKHDMSLQELIDKYGLYDED